MPAFVTARVSAMPLDSEQLAAFRGLASDLDRIDAAAYAAAGRDRLSPILGLGGRSGSGRTNTSAAWPHHCRWTARNARSTCTRCLILHRRTPGGKPSSRACWRRGSRRCCPLP